MFKVRLAISNYGAAEGVNINDMKTVYICRDGRLRLSVSIMTERDDAHIVPHKNISIYLYLFRRHTETLHFSLKKPRGFPQGFLLCVIKFLCLIFWLTGEVYTKFSERLLVHTGENNG